MYVIWSYEHNGWWRPDWCGYTNDLRQAGHYPEEETAKILKGANFENHINEVAIPVSQFVEKLGGG